MGRRKGRRYDNEPKLNIKKVIAVILVIAVIIMFVITIKKLLNTEEKEYTKNTAMSYFSVFSNNKWGVINSSGKTVIDLSYEEMIVVPNSKKPVFIAMETVDYETKTYKTKMEKVNKMEGKSENRKNIRTNGLKKPGRLRLEIFI